MQPEAGGHDFDDMLRSFDAAMPEALRLGEYLDSVEVPVSDIRVGDTVWFDEFERGHKAYPVAGFGSGVVNGRDMTGVPYVERYDHGGDYTWNSNNYVHGETARIKPRD